MPVYISMLRGINVGGYKKVSMSILRNSLESLGFRQVKTYVQSGNVVFQAAKAAPLSLSKKIEARILQDFGFPVPVITKTLDEIADAINRNPFLKEKATDITKLHVTFLSQTPQKDLVQKLDALAIPPDQFRQLGSEIYLCCPGGYGRSKLSNNAIEKALSVTATTRNWRTVNQLHKMALDYE